MQTAVETLNSYSKKLTVEISPQDLKPIEQKVLKNLQKSVSFPGFRPGKAPLNMVKQKYKDSIQQEIIEEALKKYYGKALKETNVVPVAQGKINDFKFEDIQKGMTFEIEVEVEPEVEIKKYKGLKVERDIIDVTEEMVDESLEQLREQYATVKEVGQANENHFIYFEAQELDNAGVPIIGHKYDNLQVQLGLGKFDIKIEEQLIGIKKGEKRIVRQEIPLSSPEKKKQPHIHKLEIHVRRIEEKEFPELNDDFVKNLNDESIKNLEQLRERVKQNMQIDFQHRTFQAFQNRLIDELLKENPSEVPPTMIENYLNEMVKDIKNQSKEKNIDEESVRKNYRASAIHNLRWYFMKKKLIELENISVTDDEILKMIDEAPMNEKNKKEAKKNKHYLEHLREDYLDKKVLDVLKDNAHITEIYPLKGRGEKKKSDKKSKKEK